MIHLSILHTGDQQNKLPFQIVEPELSASILPPVHDSYQLNAKPSHVSAVPTPQTNVSIPVPLANLQTVLSPQGIQNLLMPHVTIQNAPIPQVVAKAPDVPIPTPQTDIQNVSHERFPGKLPMKEVSIVYKS